MNLFVLNWYNEMVVELFKNVCNVVVGVLCNLNLKMMVECRFNVYFYNVGYLDDIEFVNY